MYSVERRYIQKSDNSPPCEGYYEYKITSFVGIMCIAHETPWISKAEYYNWKQQIIKENFPHSE